MNVGSRRLSSICLFWIWVTVIVTMRERDENHGGERNLDFTPSLFTWYIQWQLPQRSGGVFVERESGRWRRATSVCCLEGRASIEWVPGRAEAGLSLQTQSESQELLGLRAQFPGQRRTPEHHSPSRCNWGISFCKNSFFWLFFLFPMCFAQNRSKIRILSFLEHTQFVFLALGRLLVRFEVPVGILNSGTSYVCGNFIWCS